ncbi:mitochondrial ribosomal protein S6-2 precursor, putative [Babesia microti strain RI]|uniref:Mitochondrial ribosomal protein S6-2, putative n=1 Tax=Babesia microti (strain RI) TaxID=1133968 RepID=I7J6G3_BABMR|nr:mitochondrial ribosomal protein S6-2 precursor, putative [Babesia microti strain RI]CCF73762.1 mitochondrial ribosomal protein S6-2 precursor, putative [Babesia microti strain RI]|eukprot:XP_012648371.1 mitochondrial ribosomal protein S6-2 precursor, putative [Babesia microti strain RI]
MLYETYLIFSKRADPVDISNTLVNLAQIATANSGLVIRTQDLGTRYTAFKISKPNVGTFWYGRFYYIATAAHPTFVAEINRLLNSNANILRHITLKMKYKTNLLTNVYSHLYD